MDRTTALVLLVVVASLAVLTTLVFMLMIVLVFPVWLRGLLGGAPVSIVQVLGMRLRGNPPGLLVDALLVLRHQGIDASLQEVESTYIVHKGRLFSSSELAELVQEKRG